MSSGRTSQPARYFHVSTEPLPERQQQEFWRYGILNRSEADFHPEDRNKPFHGSVRGYLGNRSQLRDGTSDPIIMRRTAAMCRRDGIDEILVTALLRTSRPARMVHGGSESDMLVGEITIIDFARPMEIDAGQYRELNFRLPRSLVSGAIGRDPSRLAGMRLPRTPMTRMLFGHLRDLADSISSMTDVEREASMEVTTEFALQTLNVFVGGMPPEDDTHPDWLFVAAGRAIERNLGRRDLTPERLAQELGCSRASVYRLFQSRGLSVMEHITGLRLDKARDMLRDPENQLKIADISAACGFDDPSTFSRLFRRRFSCQPREMRVRPN